MFFGELPPIEPTFYDRERAKLPVPLQELLIMNRPYVTEFTPTTAKITFFRDSGLPYATFSYDTSVGRNCGNRTVRHHMIIGAGKLGDHDVVVMEVREYRSGKRSWCNLNRSINPRRREYWLVDEEHKTVLLLREEICHEQIKPSRPFVVFRTKNCCEGIEGVVFVSNNLEVTQL